MKNGKRPTRREKILLGEKRLNVENWLVTGSTQADAGFGTDPARSSGACAYAIPVPE